MTAYAEPLAPMMGDVAAELLGQPNKRLSSGDGTNLRFGNQGSMQVNTIEGWFHDHETGTKGGVLDLVAHKAGVADHAAAFRWLEDNGFKEPSEPGATTEPAKRIFYDYRCEAGEVLFHGIGGGGCRVRGVRDHGEGIRVRRLRRYQGGREDRAGVRP